MEKQFSTSNDFGFQFLAEAASQPCFLAALSCLKLSAQQHNHSSSPSPGRLVQTCLFQAGVPNQNPSTPTDS